MFATAIIVFREVLEAALIIGIIAAATHDIPGSRRWLLAGLLAGLLGAGIVAAFTDVIGSFASGIGQELFNAIVLGIAVLMLAWHNIWMSSHGAELAASARATGGDIRDGRSECSALLLIVGLAVLREGSETVLFLYGIVAGSQASALSLAAGGIGGLLLAAGLSWLLYRGLVAIPLHRLFSVTNGLIALLTSFDPSIQSV